MDEDKEPFSPPERRRRFLSNPAIVGVVAVAAVALLVFFVIIAIR